METKLPFIDYILKNRVLSHILFWIIMLLVQSQIFLYSGRSFYHSIIFVLAIFPAILLASYTLVYLQIPKLIFKGKYILFLISIVISGYICTVLGRILTVYIAEPIVLGLEAMPDSDFFLVILGSFDRLIKSYLISIYLAPIIMAIIKLIKLHSEENVSREKLKKEKKETELNFMKAQIHPHFLLNTLNNLYALTIKKSDKAPETVLKLSEMLQYVLYQCNEKYVLLSNEIKLLENYIALESLRYDPELVVKFKKHGITNGIKIAPLILMSILENAFKHGTSGDINIPKIDITLSVQNNQVTFVVFNTKHKDKQKDPNNYTKGIGSKNIKKQLELLYPNTHTLHVTETSKNYQVELNIPIHEA